MFIKKSALACMSDSEALCLYSYKTDDLAEEVLKDGYFNAARHLRLDDVILVRTQDAFLGLVVCDKDDQIYTAPLFVRYRKFSINDLRKKAKELGINSFNMSRAELEARIKEAQVMACAAA